MMALDGARKPAPFRLAHYLDHVTISKLIDKNLVPDIHLAGGIVQAKLFQNTRWRNAATGLLKVTAHWLGDVLELDGLFVDEADLHSVVTISTSRRFLLHHHAGAGLNDGDGCNHAVGRKNLRHANFSS